MKKSSTLATKLALVKGLGSAKDGTHHWWMQRVTALILIPLGIWFIVSLVSTLLSSPENIMAWIQSPWHATGLLLFIGAMFYHADLGMQVIYEDYISNEGMRVLAILFTKYLFIFMGIIATLAILKMFL